MLIIMLRTLLLCLFVVVFFCFFALRTYIYIYTRIVFMTWYVDNLEPIANHIVSAFIFWAFNGLWAVLSFAASVMSYDLLCERMQE